MGHNCYHPVLIEKFTVCATSNVMANGVGAVLYLQSVLNVMTWQTVLQPLCNYNLRFM